MIACAECGAEMKYCPCCGKPLEQAHPGPDVAVVISAGPTGPKDDPDVGLPPKRDLGSFSDRVSKRIRRTVSGKE